MTLDRHLQESPAVFFAQENETRSHQYSNAPSEKDQELEQNLACLTHDIRLLVNVLTGTSEALSQTAMTDQQIDLVQTMQFATDNMQALVNNFLDFKKIQTEELNFHPQPFDLCELLFSLKKAMQIRVKNHDIAIEIEIDAKLKNIFPVLDGLKLRKILFNLLDNAVKFTRKGTVSLHASLQKPGVLQFQIKDTGMGIAAHDLPTVFEPFRQIKNQKAGGSGLGLTIVKELIERQGGKITVESRLREGTTFTVTLPIEQNSPSLILGTASQPDNENTNALRGCFILAIDDNPLIQQLLRRLFDTWGCLFLFASSAAEAQLLTELHAFDLILLDINLPDQDGVALAALIKCSDSGKNQHTPLIGLSGALMAKESLRGFHTFVEKPFTSVGLQAVLQGFWQKKKSENLKIETVQPDFTWLISYCDGDLQFTKDIVELFLQDAPALIGQLQNAIFERNTHTIYQLVHRLKSNFFTIGIHSVEKQCLSIERLCMVPSADNRHILQLTEQLIAQSCASFPVIREHLGRLR
jgi:nitrogen-specific signal transduction histidine kinase/CheY-like chemotaxis protein/HPt (histidine-containing phosphotransfer) domain-containing protein